MNVLFVDACVRDESRTRRLAQRLLGRLRDESGGIPAVRRLCLEEAGIAPLDSAGLAERDRLLAAGAYDAPMLAPAREFAAADTIVIAAPYWDLSFPALLKAYAEVINVTGITFRYTETGMPSGLCRAKRLYYVATAGGPAAADVYGFGYIETLAKVFWGIPEVRRFYAEGLDVVGADPEAILAAAMEEIDRAAL